MESEERPAQLFDFVYRDGQRLDSYYSQLFGGKVLAAEASSSSRSAKTLVGKAGIAVVSGEASGVSESIEGEKNTTVPHDMGILDVLSMLRARTDDNVLTAPNGSVVRIQGTLRIIDQTLFDMAIAAWEMNVQQERSKPNKKDRDQNVIDSYEAIKKFIPKIRFPVLYVLDTLDGLTAIGAIKIDGMDEPPASLYFKGILDGMENVHVVGVKEASKASHFTPHHPLLTPGAMMFKQLMTVLIPEEDVRITPIAIFREI